MKALFRGEIDVNGVSEAVQEIFNDDDQNDDGIGSIDRIGLNLVASAPLIGQILGVIISTTLKVLLNGFVRTLNSFILRTVLLGSFLFITLPVIEAVMNYSGILDKLDLHSKMQSGGGEEDELLVAESLFEHVALEVYKAIHKFGDVDVDRVVYG